MAEKSKNGGARKGAGRPKGAVSKLSMAQREAAQASGQTPLDYMLGVMRDEKADKSRRDDMAKAAAPYVHSRFSPAEAPRSAADLSKLSDDELDALERISRKIAAAYGHPGGESSAAG